MFDAYLECVVYLKSKANPTDTADIKMQSQVAAHLNIEDSQVIRVEEWPHVLFAVISGKGGRFVSKKVLEMADQEFTAYEVAEKIADLINDSDTIYQASVWDKKAGETRVYVSYPSRKGKKDCGMIRVCDSGTIDRRLTLQAGTIEAIYEPAKALKVKPIDGTVSAIETILIGELVQIGEIVQKDSIWYEVISVETRHYDEDGHEVSEHDYAEICSTRSRSTLKPISLPEIARRHEQGYNVNPDAVVDANRAGCLSMSAAMNSDF